MTFAPFWSLNAASTKIRILTAMTLSLIIAFIVEPKLQTPPTNLIGLAIVIMGELGIGAVMGFIGRMVMNALEFAAHLISTQMGFSLATTIDPTSKAQTTVLGRLAVMVGLMMLLSVNGHHWFLISTIESYQAIQPGQFAVSAGLADLLIRISADGLTMGLSLVAPVIVILLIVELMIALAGRVVPQLQVMLLGFPIKISLGLCLLGGSLYLAPGAIHSILYAMRIGLARALTLM